MANTNVYHAAAYRSSRTFFNLYMKHATPRPTRDLQNYHHYLQKELIWELQTLDRAKTKRDHVGEEVSEEEIDRLEERVDDLCQMVSAVKAFLDETKKLYPDAA